MVAPVPRVPAHARPKAAVPGRRWQGARHGQRAVAHAPPAARRDAAVVQSSRGEEALARRLRAVAHGPPAAMACEQRGRGCNMRRRRPGRWRRCPAESCGRCCSMRGWRLRRMNHRRRNGTGGCRARSCAPGSLGRGRGMGSRSPRRARKRSRRWPRCVDRRRRGLSTAIFPRRSALSDRRARQVMRRAGLRQRGSLPRGLRSGWRRVLRPGLGRLLRRGGCEGARKNKRCYANTLRPRSRMLLKGDEGGLGGHYPLGHLRRGGGGHHPLDQISALRVTGDPPFDP